MKTHAHLETILTYLKGCNTSDVELIKSTFAPGVIHYFTTHGPIEGAGKLADYWQEYQAGDSITTWTLDHGIVEDDEAVIEFSAIENFKDGRPSEMLRGAEWYKFREGKIVEIRAYYHWVPKMPVSELVDFPYAERGYQTLSTK